MLHIHLNLHDVLHLWALAFIRIHFLHCHCVTTSAYVCPVSIQSPVFFVPHQWIYATSRCVEYIHFSHLLQALF